MGRPREHDLDTLLDHARALWVDAGMGGVTIRALSAASGASNGAIYNAFGSRDNLLARVWAREALRFLAVQTELVDEALSQQDARAAVVAAALAPARYFDREPAGARLLLAVTLDHLAQTELGTAERDQLRQLRHQLDDLVVRLALATWGSSTPPATTLVKYCVVDLPSALLLAGERVTDPLAQQALEHAVRGVLSITPPETH